MQGLYKNIFSSILLGSFLFFMTSVAFALSMCPAQLANFFHVMDTLPVQLCVSNGTNEEITVGNITIQTGGTATYMTAPTCNVEASSLNIPVGQYGVLLIGLWTNSSGKSNHFSLIF